MAIVPSIPDEQAPAAAAAASPGARRPRRERSSVWPYLFLSPFLAVFAVFGLIPVVQSLVLSFHVTSGPSAMEFVGLANFAFLLEDPDFHTAVINTIVFTAASLLIQIPLGLALAVLLNEPSLRFRNLFRFAFFVPHLVGAAFAAVLFTQVLAPRFGLMNRALGAIGLPDDTRWLQNADLVMPAVILVATWLGTGFNMIYFLAALQSVDRSLYEAATVDGAGSFARFRNVTLPGIRPVLIFVIVITTIFSFRVFELPWLLNGGMPGPDNSGLFIITYLYQNGFILGDLGYASAIGWVLTIGVVALALVQIRISRTTAEGAS
ncbi:MAG: hypothetical protein CMJ31_06585 [Phycisphaerae bacterium]|nr:hypothetical protein [Phycisphaerae bacterium]